jgi:hypothetical protein
MLLLLRTARCRHPLRLTFDASAVKGPVFFSPQVGPGCITKKIRDRKERLINDLAARTANRFMKI